jgi:hypothetical protein
VPTDYSRDILGLTEEVHCGLEGEPATNQNLDAAFKRAYEARKAFRARRKLEQQTLSTDELRRRRNREVEDRIVRARARQEQEQAAA